MKRIATIGLMATLLAVSVNIGTAQASCYGITGFRQVQARIKLQDKQTGYIRVWATKNLKGRMVGQLRHGEIIKTMKFVEDPVCGGYVYIKFRNNKGQTAHGWVFSDVLLTSIED
jgi:hypothetical protein